jgi:uncharacterized protein
VQKPFLIKNMSLASPCISVCQMDEATSYCRGCYRTLEEIAGWGRASRGDQQAVLARLPLRHQAFAFAEAQNNPAVVFKRDVKA